MSRWRLGQQVRRTFLLTARSQLLGVVEAELRLREQVARLASPPSTVRTAVQHPRPALLVALVCRTRMTLAGAVEQAVDSPRPTWRPTEAGPGTTEVCTPQLLRWVEVLRQAPLTGRARRQAGLTRPLTLVEVAVQQMRRLLRVAMAETAETSEAAEAVEAHP